MCPNGYLVRIRLVVPNHPRARKVDSRKTGKFPYFADNGTLGPDPVPPIPLGDPEGERRNRSR